MPSRRSETSSSTISSSFANTATTCPRSRAGDGEGKRLPHQYGPQRRTTPDLRVANVNVFAIRHGENQWSLTGKHTGATAIPLTDHGRRLAERMRPVLARNFSGLAFCSPMRRARETCELAGFGQDMVVDADLVEWNHA